MPESFCSALERNEFYDERYKPAIDVADRNNQRTIAHMKQLREVAEQARTAGDVETTNLFAVETEDYEVIAQAAFAQRTGFEPLFAKLMAVPIAPCAATTPAAP